MKTALPLKVIIRSLIVFMLGLSSATVFAGPGDPLSKTSKGYFNNAPVAGDDYARFLGNTINDGRYIDNDSDPDGDALSMNGITINTSGPHILIQTLITVRGGSIKFFSDGIYTYKPALNYAGLDQVTYTICDVNPDPLCSSATIYITVDPNSAVPLLPLPVNLLQFTGKRSAKDNLLQWVTAQENNLRHYELETSTDNSSYRTLAKLAAKGNSGMQQSYSTVHSTATAIVNYYRLKMVDIDGKAAYSKIIAIKSDGTGVILNTIYPNPFHDKIELALTIDRVQPISIRVYDVNGKLSVSKDVQAVKGLNVINLKGMENLQSGVYFLKVTGTIVLMETKLVKE